MTTTKTETKTIYSIQCRDMNPNTPSHNLHWWVYRTFVHDGRERALRELEYLRRQYDFREWKLAERHVVTTIETTAWKDIA